MPRDLEDQHQMALRQWAQYQPELRDHFIYIPNEGKRAPRTGAKFKRMGLMPGTSDNFIARARGGWHGFWLELKAPRPFGKNPTRLQMDFLDRMRAQGYYTAVCYGWFEARDEIIGYLNNKIKREFEKDRGLIRFPGWNGNPFAVSTATGG